MPSYLIDQSPRENRGLGRNVNHDPSSRRFAWQPSGPVTLTQVAHVRRVPKFDQGNLGSCTTNTLLGTLGTEPFYSALVAAGLIKDGKLTTPPGNPAPYTLTVPFDQDGCRTMYRRVTRRDPFPGAWEPDDTGSDGLTCAKEAKDDGWCPGYQHTFTLDAALAALQQYPLMCGTVWRSSMFDPSPDGLIPVSGTIEGGHEWIADEYVPAGQPNQTGMVLSTTEACIGMHNSWSEWWGVDGRGYFTVSAFRSLLADDGDVVVLVPVTAPAPVPVDPTDDPAVPVVPVADDHDRALWASVGRWASKDGWFHNAPRRALRTWATAKSLR